MYLDFTKNEPDWDFKLSEVTNKLGIPPTETKKMGEWATPNRQYSLTQWKYSTGPIETLNFEMVCEKIINTFKDKIDIINELKSEIGIMPSFRAVTHIFDGVSPGYSFPIEVMKFAISIDAVLEIDQYVYGFEEEDIK